MLDFLLSDSGDLFLTQDGDLILTESIKQAVEVRLRWFLEEWRLAPNFGFPYFQELLVKNPNESKIRQRIRDTVKSVDGVAAVDDVTISTDIKSRQCRIAVRFTAKREKDIAEVKISW